MSEETNSPERLIQPAEQLPASRIDNIEAQRQEFVARLEQLVPPDLRERIEQAIRLTEGTPEIVIKVSHSGATGADPE